MPFTKFFLKEAKEELLTVEALDTSVILKVSGFNTSDRLALLLLILVEE